jgi:hypothetical protein
MSLDDALLRVFIPSSITDLLRGSLGGEPWVESDMVGNSIKKAQARLQKKVISSTSTDTPDEWLAANITK